MIFFTSDLHLQHRNILHYTGRPYTDLDSMHEAIIENWNKTVSNNDLIFVLGDIAFQCQTKLEEIKDIVKRLNGKTKVVLKGNHDKYKHLNEYGFDVVAEEIYLTLDGIRLWLNHFPLKLHDDRADLQRPKARLPFDLSLCGHMHQPPSKNKTYDNWGKLIQLDVGLDGQGEYRPWAWEEIKELYNG